MTESVAPPATITLTAGPFLSGQDLWQQQSHQTQGNAIQVNVEDRNVAVIKLR